MHQRFRLPLAMGLGLLVVAVSGAVVTWPSGGLEAVRAVSQPRLKTPQDCLARCASARDGMACSPAAGLAATAQPLSTGPVRGALSDAAEVAMAGPGALAGTRCKDGGG
jgi:hypothetical protein